MEIKVGQNVMIPGTVVNVDNHRDDPAFQTVTIKCNDGQALTMNVMNVELKETPLAVGKAKAAKADASGSDKEVLTKDEFDAATKGKGKGK